MNPADTLAPIALQVLLLLGLVLLLVELVTWWRRRRARQLYATQLFLQALAAMQRRADPPQR